MPTPEYFRALYTGTGAMSGGYGGPGRAAPTMNVQSPASAPPSALGIGGNFNLSSGTQGSTAGLMLALVGGIVLLYYFTRDIQGSR